MVVVIPEYFEWSIAQVTVGQRGEDRTGSKTWETLNDGGFGIGFIKI